jgi:hypothetical protein
MPAALFHRCETCGFYASCGIEAADIAAVEPVHSASPDRNSTATTAWLDSVTSGQKQQPPDERGTVMQAAVRPHADTLCRKQLTRGGTTKHASHLARRVRFWQQWLVERAANVHACVQLQRCAKRATECPEGQSAHTSKDSSSQR